MGIVWVSGRQLFLNTVAGFPMRTSEERLQSCLPIRLAMLWGMHSNFEQTVLNCTSQMLRCRAVKLVAA